MYRLVKSIYISIYKFFFNLYYQLGNKIKKTHQKKAVFVLSRDHKLQGNLKCVYDELIKQIPDIEIHLIRAKNKMNLSLFSELNIINNARYLILEDYYLPIYIIKPSAELKVIQLWHAAGAFKKFGYSTVGTKFGPSKKYLKKVPIHSNYTHVYVSSEKIIPFYAEAFNMSTDNIYGFGIPRTDMFFDPKYKEETILHIYQSYKSLRNTNKVIILIAPTYRALGSQEETSYNFINTLNSISGELNHNVIIIFKPHPYVEKSELIQLNKHKNVIVDNKYSLNELMLIADSFITDYSSAIFDFSLLKRPFAHFVPDLKEYKQNRGFYQEIENMSLGKIIEFEKELINWINKREKNEHFNTEKMIIENFTKTKETSKIIVEHFINY